MSQSIITCRGCGFLLLYCVCENTSSDTSNAISKSFKYISLLDKEDFIKLAEYPRLIEENKRLREELNKKDM